MVLLTGWTLQPDNEFKMLRVLMVLEDYGELMFLQTVLKKIGFDVDAIQNPRSFQDSLLRMNPDVLVMTAHGKRVRGVDLCKQVKKVRDLPKVLLLKTAGAPEENEPEIDMWREAPLGAVDLLNAIAELCQLNQQVLQEKFNKLHLSEVEQEHARILKIQEIAEPSMNRGDDTGNFGMTRVEEEETGTSGNLKASVMPAEERKSRYEKFLKEAAPEKHGFSVKQVQEQVKALRKTETTAELDELERQRKAFVEHLFKKKE